MKDLKQVVEKFGKAMMAFINRKPPKPTRGKMNPEAIGKTVDELRIGDTMYYGELWNDRCVVAIVTSKEADEISTNVWVRLTSPDGGHFESVCCNREDKSFRSRAGHASTRKQFVIDGLENEKAQHNKMFNTNIDNVRAL